MLTGEAILRWIRRRAGQLDNWWLTVFNVLFMPWIPGIIRDPGGTVL
jgi:hypothetical protein